MNCAEAEPLLNARLDNELDMAGSAQIDSHLRTCRACSAQYAELEKMHREIAAADLSYVPSANLERNLAARLFGEEKAPSRFWSWRAVSLFAAAAMAAVIFFFVVPGWRPGREAEAVRVAVLDNHLRSLQPMHSVDVPSSDQHTVKPWFQGKLNFSPPVPDLSASGYVLVGGRLEVVGQQPAAAIVYRLRQHVISLYVSASTSGDAKPELADVGGYHVLHWSKDRMNFWAVSDVNAADLQHFADLIRGK